MPSQLTTVPTPLHPNGHFTQVSVLQRGARGEEETPAAPLGPFSPLCSEASAVGVLEGEAGELADAPQENTSLPGCSSEPGPSLRMSKALITRPERGAAHTHPPCLPVGVTSRAGFFHAWTEHARARTRAPEPTSSARQQRGT